MRGDVVVRSRITGGEDVKDTRIAKSIDSVFRCLVVTARLEASAIGIVCYPNIDASVFHQEYVLVRIYQHRRSRIGSSRAIDLDRHDANVPVDPDNSDH